VISRHPAQSVPLGLVILALFLLGAGIRVGLVVALHRYRVIEQPEMVEIGKTLAATGKFADPFPTPTGTTAICPPAYPFLLSLIYRAFGFNTTAQLFIQCLTGCAAALQFALLPWFAICLGFPRAVGIYSGLAGAAIPFWFWVETKGSYDTLLTSLFLLVLLAVFADRTIVRRAPLPRWYGLAWGVTLLFAPAFVTVLAALCLLTLVLSASWRQAIRDVVWTGALAALVLVPWTVRNYRDFKKLFFIRDNYGLELQISNNDLSHPLFDDNIGLVGPYATHPFRDAGEARKIVQLGEIAYFNARKTQATDWMRTHPARFLQLTLERIFFFWFIVLNETWKTVFSAAWTLAAFCGFVVAWRRNRMAALVLSPVLIVYPLAYYLIQVDERYRYPIYPTLLVLGVYAVMQALHSVRWQSKRNAVIVH